MHVILSALLLLAAIFNLVMGTGFLVNPESAGADFGLLASSLHGSSTMRGDMPAFFYVASACLGWAGWRRRTDVLLPALGLYGIAVTGRAVNLFIEGPYAGWLVPMMVEALTVALMLAAITVWGRARVGERAL